MFYIFIENENILKYFENRDITCNDVRHRDIGKDVTLVGWIPNGKTSKFLQLKDGYGQTQIIIEDQSVGICTLFVMYHLVRSLSIKHLDARQCMQCSRRYRCTSYRKGIG